VDELNAEFRVTITDWQNRKSNQPLPDWQVFETETPSIKPGGEAHIKAHYLILVKYGGGRLAS
jgi:hypothetical protein